MRYLTEFVVTPYLAEQMDSARLQYLKESKACELGRFIEQKLGFEEVETVNPDAKKYQMEVQLFTIKEWQEFKDELKGYIEVASQLGLSTFNLIVVGKMIKKLEMGAEHQKEKV